MPETAAQAYTLTARVLHWIIAATGIAIALLLCAHIGAALYHHFIRKDGVLMRMVSG
jgi:cytochrome b561